MRILSPLFSAIQFALLQPIWVCEVFFRQEKHPHTEREKVVSGKEKRLTPCPNSHNDTLPDFPRGLLTTFYSLFNLKLVGCESYRLTGKILAHLYGRRQLLAPLAFG